MGKEPIVQWIHVPQKWCNNSYGVAGAWGRVNHRGKTNDRYFEQKIEQTDMRMLYKVRTQAKFEVDTIQIGKFTNSQVPHTIQDTAKVKKITREDRIQSER